MSKHPGRKGGPHLAPPKHRDPYRVRRERPDEGYRISHNRGFPIRIYRIRMEN